MELIDRLVSFPVVLTAAPFLLLMVLMIISLLTGFLDDIDLFPESGGEAGGDLDVEGGGVYRLLVPAGFARIPLVVSLTVTLFLATVLLFYSDRWVGGLLAGWLYILAASALTLVSLFAGLHLAALVLKPLAPLLDRDSTSAKIDYTGLRATVRSSKVTRSIGEAVVTEGGIENQIDVYCDQEGEIGYGERVIVVSFDPAHRRYRVIKDR